ncbi:hypothetical protein PHYSODRAFT_480684, partial [Phytophthora sojae]
LRQQIEMVWRDARRRKHGRSGFELELFVYRKKPACQRATQPRIQEQLPRVAGFLRERQVSARPATTLYFATTQVRQPPEAPLEVPTKTPTNFVVPTNFMLHNYHPITPCN